MYVRSLELSNYRNYERVQIDFDKGVNILYGDNAVGKTNVLESIYLSSTTKSHRGSRDKEIVRFGEYEGHIRCLFEKNEVEYIGYTKESEEYYSYIIKITDQKTKETKWLKIIMKLESGTDFQMSFNVDEEG